MEQVFDRLKNRNVASYNVMIKYFALKGKLASVLNYVDKMNTAGILPNTSTFLHLLRLTDRSSSLNKVWRTTRSVLEAKDGMDPLEAGELEKFKEVVQRLSSL